VVSLGQIAERAGVELVRRGSSLAAR